MGNTLNLLDPENMKKLLSELDDDCKARLATAAIGGKKAFLSQLTLECGIQNRRNEQKKD